MQGAGVNSAALQAYLQNQWMMRYLATLPAPFATMLLLAGYGWQQ
jgi:hypothetical protein